MRKTMLFSGCMLICHFLFSQTKEYYIEKSKKQKTAAWVLLGVGSAAVITGIIIDGNRDPEQQSFTGGYLEVGGAICVLTSVPFFIGSARNKKRAAKLAINHQRIPLPYNNSMVFKRQAGVSLLVAL